MIENEIAKLEKPLQPRFSSCLYPSSASRCSSLGRVLPLCSSPALFEEKVC